MDKMLEMISVVMGYWDNNKSLKKTFKDGKVIGATFRDIRYDELMSDETFQTMLESAEANGISVNHRKQGDRFKVWDKELNRLVTKEVQADYIYIGEDVRTSYDKASDIFA
tara:strand:+ start:232 stop:564 length:333 start_codon:yes stop_codon:yes gene_type:complete